MCWTSQKERRHQKTPSFLELQTPVLTSSSYRGTELKYPVCEMSIMHMPGAVPGTGAMQAVEYSDGVQLCRLQLGIQVEIKLSISFMKL